MPLLVFALNVQLAFMLCMSPAVIYFA